MRPSPRVTGGGESDTFDQQHRTKIPEQDPQRGQRIPHHVQARLRGDAFSTQGWSGWTSAGRTPPGTQTSHIPRNRLHVGHGQTCTTETIKRSQQTGLASAPPGHAHRPAATRNAGVPTQPSARPLQTPTRLRLPWRGGYNHHFSGHTKTSAEAEPPVVVTGAPPGRTAPPARVGALRLRWKRSRPSRGVCRA